MSSIRFSAGSSATAATQITVGLGGTPNVGDLVLVWLVTSNEIIVQPPGYNGTNQWFKAGGIRKPSAHSVLSSYYHTWNAADSGNSVVFTFQPAPSLGIGDIDLSNANSTAVAVVIIGGPAVLDMSFQSSRESFSNTLSLPPAKRAASSSFTGVFNTAGLPWTAADGTLVINKTSNGQSVSVFKNTAPVGVGYTDTFTVASFDDWLLAGFTLSDNGPQAYNPPVIQEAPVANDDPLFMRYKLQRYYTVLNNGGTFSATRYNSTDQIAAATQVFTNNAPVTSTDRTNLLNAGLGGDFRAFS